MIQRTPVATAITASNDVNCFGESSGSATVSANGGDGNFTYAWSNGATTATASNLIAGNYSVVVTDGDGCTSSQSVVLTQPTQLLVNAAATPQSTFGVDDGTATANPSGGTGKSRLATELRTCAIATSARVEPDRTLPTRRVTRDQPTNSTSTAGTSPAAADRDRRVLTASLPRGP